MAMGTEREMETAMATAMETETATVT